MAVKSAVEQKHSKKNASRAAKNWIGGEWTDSSKQSESFDPATGERIGTYADGGLEEAEAATLPRFEPSNQPGGKTTEKCGREFSIGWLMFLKRAAPI